MIAGVFRNASENLIQLPENVSKSGRAGRAYDASRDASYGLARPMASAGVRSTCVDQARRSSFCSGRIFFARIGFRFSGSCSRPDGDLTRGRSSMVERQLPKLHTRVRFPSPAPGSASISEHRYLNIDIRTWFWKRSSLEPELIGASTAPACILRGSSPYPAGQHPATQPADLAGRARRCLHRPRDPLLGQPVVRAAVRRQRHSHCNKR